MSEPTVNRVRNAELCIHPDYRMRTEPEHFDDRALRDQWQDEVYAHARALALRNDCRSVVDFGCGSGFKLMKYFSGFATIGYELEPALSHLRQTYPDRDWRGNYPPRFVGDLFIAADVIEHMQDPTALLRALADSTVGIIVLSTPALEILAERGASPRFGPPDNRSHLNEWTTLEFRSYVDMHLDITEHLVDARQGTQIIVARRRKAR
jgi:hypothetical protein